MSIFKQLKGMDEKNRIIALNYYLDKATRDSKLLRSIYFEITPLCTLDCKMCYVKLKPHEVDQHDKILTGEEWISIAKQALVLGVEYLTLTGGECMLHPEFENIYKSIHEMGLRVVVLTNATLIDEKAIDLFIRYRPTRLSITLYGFSEDTYERACGNGKAFYSVYNAIERIIKEGLPLTLKGTITQDMVDDLPAIYRYVKERNIRFQYTNTLNAGRNATLSIVKETEVDEKYFHEVEDDFIVRLQSQKGTDLRDFFDKEHIIERGIWCGAGNNSMHITWNGRTPPCAMLDAFEDSILEHSLAECWYSIHQWAATVPQIVECQKCNYQSKCKHCIALHYGDTHEFGKPSPRLCYKVQHGITD